MGKIPHAAKADDGLGTLENLPGLDDETRTRLAALIDEGWQIWERFDLEVRTQDFHPFVAADYEQVLRALLPLRAPGQRFLEWGSATGVITIMADMLGFEAYGIELDASLVETARGLAARHGSKATFVAGSFLPNSYRWRPRGGGDARIGTIGTGDSAYPELGRALDDFDVVYGYPWTGEEPMMQDLMRTFGAQDARLLLHGGSLGLRVFRGGKQVG
ncbi:class I SAM-dependent methyltransferase [Longimicrobium terrae]|uniref:Class I SAM-dependent methyltransferase n=1 Tax=Longimicrobium terrae TaxID=1639882 RepID=A0A841H388_9BACT|nr:class I SAM-dependent methyltransferase [Longimicrobium terrae]MBB4637758.1 hypothetical protein [Longimicrobium terrae]MBB6072386.1 hypothetical protein [Longimicrobium terrae]NNC31304.1 class I SAM-dependent methyltransferase [Longimicrobium terrae]